MKKGMSFLLVALVLGAPPALLADPRGDAILGGALGGAAGAAIGSELGGRDGAILGGAIGGATGTAITTQRYRRSQPEVIYVDRYQYVERPVYVAPRAYGPPPYHHYPGRHLGHYKHHHKHYHHYYDD